MMPVATMPEKHAGDKIRLLIYTISRVHTSPGERINYGATKKKKQGVVGQVYSDCVQCKSGSRIMIQNDTAAHTEHALVFLSLESRNDELDYNSGIL